MKSAILASLFCAHALAGAVDAPTALTLSMELKEGDAVVGTPRMVVLSGARASISVGSKTAGTSTGASGQHDWNVNVQPTLDPSGDVLTSFSIKFSALAANGATNTRSMSAEIKQTLGESITIQIPGSSDEPPLSVTMKAETTKR